MKIPRWSLHFIVSTFRFITMGTLFGIIAFPLVGLVIKTAHSPLQLAWLGAQTFGLGSSLIGPIFGLVVTARKVTNSAQSPSPSIDNDSAA